MKSYFKIYCVTVLLLLTFFSCSNSVKNAYEYNNVISNEEILATESIYRFKATIENQNHKDLERLKEEGVATINKCIESTKTLEDYNGSLDYKNAALDLFETYIKISENEFTAIIELFKQNNSFISGETYSKVLKIDQQTDKKIEAKLNILKKRQLEFAENNNLLVVKNE